jgi:(2S)-methylsuccinyl-CoA dehydrogenase
MAVVTLADRRQELKRKVAADGIDAHQFEAYELAWAYARAEAAKATAEWARRTGSEAARLSAEVAAAEAEGRAEDGGLLEARGRALAATEDLGASDDHRLLRSSIRDFAEREIKPHAQEIHRQDLDIPESIIRGAAALGLFGLSVPERYGGSAAAESDHTAMLIVTEELSRASLAAGGSLITRPEILIRALLRAGSEEQKRQLLPPIASGEKLVAVAVTEPDAGSDVARVQCRATQGDDGGWTVDGTKLWCTWAGRCELLMLLCRTSAQGHRGLSLFVGEKPAFNGHEFEYRQPEGGLLRGRAIPTLGYRGMHTFELQFEHFRLPPQALIGDEGRGFYLQMEGFSVGRLQTAARAVGVMQGAYEDAVDYTRGRTVFGQAVAEYQLPRAMLGRIASRLDASRQLAYRAARLFDEGKGQMEASLAKLCASRNAELATRDAMQLFGGMGYGEETDVSRHFVDARVLTIFEGAEEVLALRVIAKALLEDSRD